MNNLHEVFDIVPSEDSTIDIPKTEIIPVSETAEDDDFNAARDNTYELIDISKAALTTAMLIASETQNPRAIEVLSGLLKTSAEINRQLVQMSKDKQEVKVTRAQVTGKALPPSGAGGTTQNVTFIGTSADLNRLLAEKLAGMNKG